MFMYLNKDSHCILRFNFILISNIKFKFLNVKDVSKKINYCEINQTNLINK